jgi:Predicted membrane protein
VISQKEEWDMSNKIYKKLLSVLVGFILIIIGILLGRQSNTVSEITPKSTIRTIAVVNLDEGIQINTEYINFANQLISYRSDNFKTVSLEEARRGVVDGHFAAYIIIPQNFSKSVESINNNLGKVVLDYAINPDIRDDIKIKIFEEINMFEIELNNNISYMYLYAILEEFHLAQDSAYTVVQSNVINYNQLVKVMADDLVKMPEYVELRYITTEIADLDIENEQNMGQVVVEELKTKYNGYFERAKEDYDDVLSESQRLTGRIEGFIEDIGNINLFALDNGDTIYQVGYEELITYLNIYDTSINDSRQGLVNTLGETEIGLKTRGNAWFDALAILVTTQSDSYEIDIRSIAQSDILYDMSVDMELTIKENREEFAKEVLKEGYNKTRRDIENLSLDESVKYQIISMLYENCIDDADIIIASTSNALELLAQETPSEATPSNATLSNATPSNASSSNAIPFERIDFLDILVTLQSFIMDILPVYNISIDEATADFKQEFTQCVDERIDEVLGINSISMGNIQQIIDDEIIYPIETRKTEIVSGLGVGIEEINVRRSDYLDLVERYDIFKYLDENELGITVDKFNIAINSMENKLNRKMSEYGKLVGEMQSTERENTSELKNSIDISNESTIESVEFALNNLKTDRREVNIDNEDLLSTFINKLPHTRNGSIPATGVYDFIIKPVESNNNELISKGTYVIRKSSVNMIAIGSISGLIFIVSTLLMTINKKKVQ